MIKRELSGNTDTRCRILRSRQLYPLHSERHQVFEVAHHPKYSSSSREHAASSNWLEQPPRCRPRAPTTTALPQKELLEASQSQFNRTYFSVCREASSWSPTSSCRSHRE